MRTRSRAPKQTKEQKPVSKDKKVRKNNSKKDQEKQEKKVDNKVNDEQKVEQQKEQKKAPKPKKYLKKNYDQASRIARSQYQKIYLLEAERNEEEAWDFMVQGASGSHYRVHVHHTSMKCTCIDFRMKQSPCKHIYFIVTQVAQNLEILDYFNTTSKISKAAYDILDKQLTQRLKSRMQKPAEQDAKNIDLKDDTDCTICFTQMDKQNQKLEDCQTCKKYFHFECLAAWKKHNPTCPLCRGQMQRGSGDLNDPLGKLSGIQIKSSQ